VEYKAVGSAYGCTLSWSCASRALEVIPQNRVFSISFFSGTPISCIVYAEQNALSFSMSGEPVSFDVLGSSLVTLFGKGFLSLIDQSHCLFVSEDSQFQALSSPANVDSDNSVVCVSPPWFFEGTMSFVILINDGLFIESSTESFVDYPRYGKSLF
jgi:hypothetical protein